MKDRHESAFQDLRPVALDRVAARRHAERREADLAAAFGAGAEGFSATPETSARRRMPRFRTAGLAAASVAAIAVAVIAVNGAGDPNGHEGRRSVTHTSPSPIRRIDARTVLLASAETAAKAPVTTGRYWYTDQRTESYTDQLVKPGRPGTRPKITKLSYGAFVSGGQETWIGRDGRDRSRTITGIDIRTRFPTQADEAEWRRTGAPDLTDGEKRSVNNYDTPIHYVIGNKQVTMDQLRKLPTSAPKLKAALHKRWRADGRDGLTDGFTYYVWMTAQDLLAGPITPGTKAALYRVLATLPGIRYAGEVKDSLGRTGQALAMADPAGRMADGRTRQLRLVVDPLTGRLLAYESWENGRAFPMLSEAYRSMGWVGGLNKRS